MHEPHSYNAGTMMVVMVAEAGPARVHLTQLHKHTDKSQSAWCVARSLYIYILCTL